MSVQISDNLIYQGQTINVDDGRGFLNPFGGLPNSKKILEEFYSRRLSTACRRGYIADWEFRNKKLYLSHLTNQIFGTALKDKQVNLIHDLYGLELGLVFASWISQDFIGYSGKCVDHIDWYLPVFESYHLFEVKQGVLINYVAHDSDWWIERHT